jgi:phospholipase C
MKDSSRITRRRFAKELGIAAAAGAAIPTWAAAQTSNPDPQRALDHVVVLMFENRSFDNVLGRLYQPGEVAAFEGVVGKNLRNRIPAWADHGADRQFVPYGVATNMNTPDPDPGEEYPHINTQIYGTLDPTNRFMPLSKMVAPYNAPAAGQEATMDGFVADYISMFTSEMGRQPTYDEYAQIMTGYTPQQLPVLSTLARNFAVFDHWFCEVPSQTFTNRSFFHAATASGFVLNYPPVEAFPVHNTAETIFERLEDKGLTWRVYCDAPSAASFTGVIHAARLRERFASNFFTVDDFVEDARNGRLPTYAFIEPDMWVGHNDMHPPISALLHGAKVDMPSSLLGGEALLAKVYGAIRSSASTTGSNYLNTLLLVTFDEAGGTYDHVAPPAAVPPTAGAAAGQMGFTFDRFGIRVPAIAISPWISAQTVITQNYQHTSVIRTLRDRWSLGPPLTARDATAPSLAPLLSLRAPRTAENWPDVNPQPVPPFNAANFAPDRPLGVLGKSLFLSLLAFEKAMGAKVPTISKDASITAAQADEIVRNASFSIFPGLRAKSGSA